MGKKTVESVVAGVLVLVLGIASAPARAEYSLKILRGQYSPHLRKINEDFKLTVAAVIVLGIYKFSPFT